MKHIKYFENISDYENWINNEANIDELYKNEEKICIDGVIVSHTESIFEEI